jgi:hypothetical protein
MMTETAAVERSMMVRRGVRFTSTMVVILRGGEEWREE